MGSVFAQRAAAVAPPAAAWMDLDAIADSFDDPQTSAPEWERYWFNRPVSLQGTWLQQRAWDECFDARPMPRRLLARVPRASPAR